MVGYLCFWVCYVVEVPVVSVIFLYIQFELSSKSIPSVRFQEFGLYLASLSCL